MNLKKTLKNLSLFLVLFGYIYLLGDVWKGLEKEAMENFDPQKLILFICFAYIPFGLIMGLITHSNKFSQKGEWRIDLNKLLVIGIPALYFAVYPFINRYIPSLDIQLYNLINISEMAKLMGVVTGYTIISSLYREVKEEQIIENENE